MSKSKFLLMVVAALIVLPSIGCDQPVAPDSDPDASSPEVVVDVAVDKVNWDMQLMNVRLDLAKQAAINSDIEHRMSNVEKIVKQARGIPSPPPETKSSFDLLTSDGQAVSLKNISFKKSRKQDNILDDVLSATDELPSETDTAIPDIEQTIDQPIVEQPVVNQVINEPVVQSYQSNPVQSSYSTYSTTGRMLGKKSYSTQIQTRRKTIQVPKTTYETKVIEEPVQVQVEYQDVIETQTRQVPVTVNKTRLRTVNKTRMVPKQRVVTDMVPETYTEQVPETYQTTEMRTESRQVVKRVQTKNPVAMAPVRSAQPVSYQYRQPVVVNNSPVMNCQTCPAPVATALVATAPVAMAPTYAAPLPQTYSQLCRVAPEPLQQFASYIQPVAAPAYEQVLAPAVNYATQQYSTQQYASPATVVVNSAAPDRAGFLKRVGNRIQTASTTMQKQRTQAVQQRTQKRQMQNAQPPAYQSMQTSSAPQCQMVNGQMVCPMQTSAPVQTGGLGVTAW